MDNVPEKANYFMLFLLPFAAIFPLLMLMPISFIEGLGLGWGILNFAYISFFACLGIVVTWVLKSIYIWGSKEDKRVEAQKEGRRRHYQQLKDEFEDNE